MSLDALIIDAGIVRGRMPVVLLQYRRIVIRPCKMHLKTYLWRKQKLVYLFLGTGLRLHGDVLIIRSGHFIIVIMFRVRRLWNCPLSKVSVRQRVNPSRTRATGFVGRKKWGDLPTLGFYTTHPPYGDLQPLPHTSRR